MSERLIVVSTDCHAGLHISAYKPYVETKYHEMMDLAVPVQLDMMAKAEQSFLIKEINDEWRAPIQQQLTGAWDYTERLKMLAGDGIAAEIIFPDGIKESNSSARWLLNVTNDAWFGTSSGPYQHFAMARLRSVEQGLPLVRAANTGISGTTDAYGRVIGRLGLNEQGVVDSALPQAFDEPTLFSRFGSWPIIILAGLSFLSTIIRRTT